MIDWVREVELNGRIASAQQEAYRANIGWHEANMKIVELEQTIARQAEGMARLGSELVAERQSASMDRAAIETMDGWLQKLCDMFDGCEADELADMVAELKNAPHPNAALVRAFARRAEMAEAYSEIEKKRSNGLTVIAESVEAELMEAKRCHKADVEHYEAKIAELRTELESINRVSGCHTLGSLFSECPTCKRQMETEMAVKQLRADLATRDALIDEMLVSMKGLEDAKERSEQTVIDLYTERNKLHADYAEAWNRVKDNECQITRMAETIREFKAFKESIEAAKAGEAPMPLWGLDGCGSWRQDCQDMEAWGRQGWDASAVLRVELAETEKERWGAKQDNCRLDAVNTDLECRLARYEQAEGEIPTMPTMPYAILASRDYTILRSYSDNIRAMLVKAKADCATERERCIQAAIKWYNSPVNLGGPDDGLRKALEANQ